MLHSDESVDESGGKSSADGLATATRKCVLDGFGKKYQDSLEPAWGS